MKYYLVTAFISLAFINCNDATNTLESPIIKNSPDRVSRKDSISQKENNVKVMLTLIKRDYPDGKNRIMDSTKKVFEKRIAELDSLKNAK